MKNLILIITTLLLSTSIFAQKKKDIPVFEGYHKNITFELLGSHLLKGINFDMRLKRGQMDGFGFKAGIGGFSLEGTDGQDMASLGMVTMPIEINHIVGKKRHGFVSGVGILPVYAAVSGSGPSFGGDPIEVDGFGVIGGYLNLGYRFQPLRNGFTWQINYNPYVMKNVGYQSYVGIQFGFGFK